MWNSLIDEKTDNIFIDPLIHKIRLILGVLFVCLKLTASFYNLSRSFPFWCLVELAKLGDNINTKPNNDRKYCQRPKIGDDTIYIYYVIHQYFADFRPGPGNVTTCTWGHKQI